MFTKVFALIALFGIAAASLPIVYEPAYHHAPQPYKFGYDVKDKHGEQYRQEEGNGGQAVKGSYGFTDVRGVRRQVNYVADHGGFRAQVKTNEPGTGNQNPAAVLMVSNAPYAGGIAFGGMGYGNAGYGNAGYGNVGYGNVGYGNAGYGNAGYGLGYNGNLGNGYGGAAAYGRNALGYGILGGLGYARYGY